MSEIRARLQKADPAILWLLSGLLLVIVPHILYQSRLLLLTIGILLAWRLCIEFKLCKQPPGWLNTLFAIAAFVGITYSYQTIFGRDAGVGLLITMTCLKLMEMNTRRDFMVAVFLGYFVVITGFLFNQALFIGLLMTTAVFLLTTSLVSYHRNNKSSDAQYKSAKLALVLLVQALPLTLLLFFLFPRVSGPLWGMPDNGTMGKTGLSNSMAPGQITELAFDNSVAFRVQFNDNRVPDPSKLYWRGPVFTYYDGYMWQDLSSKSRIISFEEEWITEASIKPEIDEQSAIEYSVTMEANNKQWLLALDIPVALPEGSYLTSNYELISDDPVKTIKNYRVTSYSNYKLQADSAQTNKVFTQVPQFIGTKARRLVAQLRDQVQQGTQVDMQMVRLVLDYIRDGPFYYTRTPPAMLDNPVDRFLFEERMGFCEHYASAFVTLMRLAGIPARIVTGYLGGEFNSIGNYLIVRQSDAHAWTEVWLQGQGWTRVDPTAVIPPERVLQAQFRNRLRQDNEPASDGSAWSGWISSSLKNFKHFWDNVNHQWNHWVVGYTPDTQISLLKILGLNRLPVVLIVCVMIVLITVTLIAISIFITRKHQPRFSAAQLLYRKFCRKLARKGIKHQPSETALHFAARIASVRRDIAGEVDDIVNLYNRLRYTNCAPEPTLQELQRQINEFKP